MDKLGTILLIQGRQNQTVISRSSLQAFGYEVITQSSFRVPVATISKLKIRICIIEHGDDPGPALAFSARLKKILPLIPVLTIARPTCATGADTLLAAGIDCPLREPILMEELRCRLEVWRKRYRIPYFDDKEMHRLGFFTFSHQEHKLQNSHTGAIIRLSRLASALLLHLCRNKNKSVSRSEILKAVWGDDSWDNGRSMDVLICHLRSYLKTDSSIQIITEFGRGFKFHVSKRQYIRKTATGNRKMPSKIAKAA